MNIQVIKSRRRTIGIEVHADGKVIVRTPLRMSSAEINRFIEEHDEWNNINALVLLIILLSSIAGQFGDLFASKIKRYTEIKDYAQILPGHGGILDRFDSLIFISPFIYILYNLI